MHGKHATYSQPIMPYNTTLMHSHPHPRHRNHSRPIHRRRLQHLDPNPLPLLASQPKEELPNVLNIPLFLHIVELEAEIPKQRSHDEVEFGPSETL